VFRTIAIIIFANIIAKEDAIAIHNVRQDIATTGIADWSTPL
jgi:hypothetical protein